MVLLPLSALDLFSVSKCIIVMIWIVNLWGLRYFFEGRFFLRQLTETKEHSVFKPQILQDGSETSPPLKLPGHLIAHVWIHVHPL